MIAIGSFLVTILQFIFGNEMSAHLLTHIFEKDNSHRNTELSKRGQLKLLTKRKAQKVKSRCLSSKKMKTNLEISEQRIEKELDVVHFVR